MVSGSIPNLYVGAVSQEQLRQQHPRYVALPPLNSVIIQDELDYRYVRQNTQLWNDLHDGVLTGRFINAVLGFCEPHASRRLNLPPFLINHQKAVSAIQHLRLTPAATVGKSGGEPNWQNYRLMMSDHKQKVSELSSDSDRINLFEDSNSMEQIAECVELSKMGIGAIRCCWGGIHEHTAMHDVLMHLSDADVMEVGLCMTTQQQNKLLYPNLDLPLIGASPDGLILYNGTQYEVLEVKNVCPFAADRTFQMHAQRQERYWYVLNDRGPYEMVQVNFIPQLYLEMFATNSRSALLVIRSSTKGFKAFRLLRNDEYMYILLRYVSKFYRQFVKGRQRLGQNFFYQEALYQKFLQMTLKIAMEAQLVLESVTPNSDQKLQFFLDV